MKTNPLHTRISRRDLLKTLGLMLPLALSKGNIIAQTPAPAKPAEPVFPPIIPEVPLTAFDAPKGTWTLVALPDTQYYSQFRPDVFDRQTEWLIKNRKQHNILFALHEGDVVNADVDKQWVNARKSMDILNQGALPYAIAPGNHDYSMKKPGRSTLLNTYFSAADYKNSEKMELFERGRMENSWHTLTTLWGPFLIFALEYGPRDETLAWANAVAAKCLDHRIIVVTHAHIYSDSTRYDWEKYGDQQKWNPKTAAFAKTTGANDGEEVWEKFLSKQPQMRLVFNGHVLNDGTGYVASTLPNGKTVHQILANYQQGVKPDRGYGGGGYLRLMQFFPDKKTLRIKSYSPLYDKWLTDADQQFELTVE